MCIWKLIKLIFYKKEKDKVILNIIRKRMLNDEFAFNKQRYNLTASIPISYICKKKERKLGEKKLEWKKRRVEILNGPHWSYRCNRKNNVELSRDRSSWAAINEFQSTGLCFTNQGSAEAFRTSQR